jgi:hypothetical protein
MYQCCLVVFAVSTKHTSCAAQVLMSQHFCYHMPVMKLTVRVAFSLHNTIADTTGHL